MQEFLLAVLHPGHRQTIEQDAADLPDGQDDDVKVPALEDMRDPVGALPLGSRKYKKFRSLTYFTSLGRCQGGRIHLFIFRHVDPAPANVPRRHRATAANQQQGNRRRPRARPDSLPATIPRRPRPYVRRVSRAGTNGKQAQGAQEEQVDWEEMIPAPPPVIIEPHNEEPRAEPQMVAADIEKVGRRQNLRVNRETPPINDDRPIIVDDGDHDISHINISISLSARRTVSHTLRVAARARNRTTRTVK